MTTSLDPGLLAVVLGLAAALTWGAGDFSGGLASRRADVFWVVALSQGVGLVLLAGLALLFGEPVPSAEGLAWGGAAGLAGGAAVAALYRALAIGQMGIAAPVTAVLAAAAPVLYGAVSEGAPGGLQVAGFGAALIGVWLLARPSGESGRPRGLALAIFSGLGIGAFLILLNQAGQAALFWPLVAARVASFTVMLVVVLAGRRPWGPVRGLLPLVLLAGVMDVAGNALYVMATQVGRLDVSAVLSSLYPASTILLAWLLLKERVSRSQGLGIAAALVAIPLIAS
jgi:drug/metabolite transporter (DMT)-like permease